MSQAHFQTELFHEIIQGIATSCESYLLDGKEMIDAAAKIYGYLTFSVVLDKHTTSL